MKPAAGVTVASPAMAPVAKPTVVGFPKVKRSMASHTSAAVEAAAWVLMIALAAPSEAVRAEPPLKPNQPTHSSIAPSIVRPGACGISAAPGKPCRRPSSSAMTRAEIPAVVWTTIPPAKSSTPRSASQPPPHTQCATGA
jgi:hypothetical protein